MKFGKYRPTKTLLLVAVLSLLLIALATLQYRWLGQVSLGERERMQASLDAGTMRFSQDFNREITRAYMSFQIDASMLDGEKVAGLTERIDEWNANAPYPRLVSELYLIVKQEQYGATLHRFNRALEKFELAEWPSEFGEVRQRLEHGMMNVAGGPEFIKEMSISPVDASIPALVTPVIGEPRVVIPGKENVREDQKEHIKRLTTGTSLAGYLIIKLDIDVIANELIPTLAKRYFSGTSGLEYNLAVINLKQPDKAIYRSEGGKDETQPIKGDATASLMNILPEQLDTLWFGLPRRAAKDEDKSSKVEHKLPPGDVVVRTDSETENGTSSKRSVTVRVFNREMKQLESVDKTTASGPWQLLIQHRAGSLEAAVTSARRRNLAVSFGILLLLAGSVAMIVVSTRRAERLANRQMEFVSAVSHEFRTPLSVICSASENLADGVIKTPIQTKKYGELIRNEGRRLTEMVEQVLEFAGARSRHRTYQFHPVDIESMIDDALTSFKPVIEEKGYVVEKELEPDLPQVDVDSAAIRSSLQNLISNAMKYESEKRWIGIRAKSAGAPGGEEIQLSIEDHGIGIAPDEVSHVFEPFYRCRDVVEAQIHGNGLGLSLVKQVIEAHNGRVSVVSAPGKGSAFTLHLPITSQKARENGKNDGAVL